MSDIDAIIAKLRKQEKDDSTFEAKECSSTLSKSIWESVSAFANTEGGELLLGLSEANGFAPVNNFQIDRVRDQFISGMGDGSTKAKLTNPPSYHIRADEFETKPILRITIDELDCSYKPCFVTERGVQGGSYKRIDDKDIPLTPNEIFSLQYANTLCNSDRRAVPEAKTADLDENVLTQAFAKAALVTPRALKNASTADKKMRRLNFTDHNSHVTKAGLLCAGVYPQEFFPKLLVDVAVHAGTEKSTLDGPRFIDRTLCEGTLGEMIESAVAAVSKNLKRSSSVRGLARIDDLEIPVTVLREAVANALIHREYDQRFDGEAVSIDIFDDRIEVTNPGGLWGKSRADILDGRSCCRNATLMRLMSIVPLPNEAGSPAEGNGSGMLLIVRECAAKGLRPPVFHPSFDHFKTILFRPSARKAVQTGQTMEDGERLLIELLEEHGELSAKDLANKSGLSINQVRTRMNKLLSKGTAEATASATSRNRKYKLARK